MRPAIVEPLHVALGVTVNGPTVGLFRSQANAVQTEQFQLITVDGKHIQNIIV